MKIAPFQEAGPAEVSQNFAAIKAQVRAIVSGPASPNQEPEQPVLASPATTPALGHLDEDEDEGPLSGL